MVLFEAMAAGVPIVATAVGGVPDMVSDREALLVMGTEPAALGAALAAVSADPAAASTRAESAARRLDEYRIEPWVARYVAVYQAVLATRRSRATA